MDGSLRITKSPVALKVLVVHSSGCRWSWRGGLAVKSHTALSWQLRGLGWSLFSGLRAFFPILVKQQDSFLRFQSQPHWFLAVTASP